MAKAGSPPRLLRPAEALAVFQWQITRLLERKDRYSAQEAVKLLRVVRRRLRRLGRTEEFDDYVAALLACYGRQRSLRRLPGAVLTFIGQPDR